MVCLVAMTGNLGTLKLVRDSLRRYNAVVLVTGLDECCPLEILAFAISRTRPTLPALPLGGNGPACVFVLTTDFEFLYTILHLWR